MTRAVFATLAVTAVVLASAPAHAGGGFSRVEPTWGDAGFLMVAVPVALALEGIPPAPHAREPGQPCAREPRDVDLLDGAATIEVRRSVDCRIRDGATWRRPDAAAAVSDVFLYAWLTAPAWAPIGGQSIWGTGPDDHVGAGSMVGFEAMAATYVITGLLKHTTRRIRPGGTDGPYDDAFASFPSGHSSMAFSGATLLTLYAYEYEWGRSQNRWLVPTTAYAAAAFTGYLRIGARRHWLTDVFVGALIGTGTTLVTHAARL